MQLLFYLPQVMKLFTAPAYTEKVTVNSLPGGCGLLGIVMRGVWCSYVWIRRL